MTALAVSLLLAGLAAGPCLLARPRRLQRADESAQMPAAHELSVIIPARNEAFSLPALLHSIGRSTVAPLEVIVVDDSSTDGTGEIAAAYGATVVKAPPLPEGWLGKPWACWTGASCARGEHLLFLDADVTLGPDALERLCAACAPGLLSVQPFHHAVHRYESLSAVFNLVTAMGSGAFACVGSPPATIAFGPCMLTPTADYVAVGGHRAVADAVVEDAALAAKYSRNGLPVRHLTGADAISFRMYPDGLRSLVDGWTRTLASGASFARPLAVGLAAAWVASCLAISVTAARWLIDGGGAGWPPVLYVLTAALMAVLLRRVGRFRWWTWVAFPVGVGCFVAVCARSLWRTYCRRELDWRARRLHVRRVGPLPRHRA